MYRSSGGVLAMGEGGYTCIEIEGCEKSLHFSFNFAVNLTLLLKIVFKKKMNHTTYVGTDF